LGRQIKIARSATREPVGAACNGEPAVSAPDTRQLELFAVQA